MGKYDHDPYAGFFDFNGDGKTDFAEECLGFQLSREQEAEWQKKYGHSTVPQSSSYRPRPASYSHSHYPEPEPEPMTEEERAAAERRAKFSGHDSAEEWLQSARKERNKPLIAAIAVTLYTIFFAIIISTSGESDGILAGVILFAVLPPVIIVIACVYGVVYKTEDVRAAKKALEEERSE